MKSLSKLPQQRVDPVTVNGWGVDADPRNDPTYPYRIRELERHDGMDWERPPLQRPRHEILRSIEHNRLPAVVGSSVPPRGISGMMRRAAFSYSESDWRHWLMLLTADRVNVAEGVASDLGRGQVPNILGEMGARAEWRHNRAGFIGKAAILAAASVVAVALYKRRRR